MHQVVLGHTDPKMLQCIDDSRICVQVICPILPLTSYSAWHGSRLDEVPVHQASSVLTAVAAGTPTSFCS